MNHLAGPGMRNLLSVTNRCENHQAPPGGKNHKSISFSCASGTVLIKKSIYLMICIFPNEIVFVFADKKLKSSPKAVHEGPLVCGVLLSEVNQAEKVKVNLIVKGK